MGENVVNSCMCITELNFYLTHTFLVGIYAYTPVRIYAVSIQSH
jgi:hypothetical protein